MLSSITDSNKIISRIDSHDNFSKHNLNEWIMNITKPKNDELILDMGCGPGKQILKIKESCPTARIIGLDKTVSSLKIIENFCIEKSISNVSVINGDLDDLNELLKNFNDFSLIFSSFALYYSKNIEKLISDIKNKLKSNGRFFCCGPIKGNNEELITFQQSITNSNLEDVKYKMKDEILPSIEQTFKSTTTEYLENPISFPDVQSVMNYWKSSWLYEEKIENQFLEKLKLFFQNNDNFITTKKIIGILGNN